MHKQTDDGLLTLMSLKLYANEHLSFPLGEANFVPSPTAWRVCGVQIMMLQREFSACVLRLKLFCDQAHRDLAQRITRLWCRALWHEWSLLQLQQKVCFCIQF